MHTPFNMSAARAGNARLGALELRRTVTVRLLSIENDRLIAEGNWESKRQNELLAEIVAIDLQIHQLEA